MSHDLLECCDVSPSVLDNDHVVDHKSHSERNALSIVERLIPYKDLRVLISGGAAGIGAVLAAAYVEAGSMVHVCDISKKSLAQFRECSPASLATLADVADAAQIKAVFTAQVERFGGLDVLINNAGIAGATGGIG